MPAKIDVYGWQGVNVTKNPIQLEDRELTKAQNAFRDAAGEHGALRKRPGLTKINSTALSGSINGFVNVPLNQIAVERFLIGIDQTVQSTYQWVTSINEFGAYTTATTPGAPYGRVTGMVSGAIGAFNHYRLGSLALVENLLIYPGDHDSSNPGSTPATLRIWDGTQDRVLLTVPTNPRNVPGTSGTDYTVATHSMILDGTKLYFISVDSLTFNARQGRVFQYDFETGDLLQIGESLGVEATEITNGNSAGTALVMHQGYLYLSAGSPALDAAESDPGIWRIRPGVDSVWTKDYLQTNQNILITTLVSYKGLLYAGSTNRVDVGATAQLLVRSTAGVYSNSTNSGALTDAGAGWSSMIVFGDNLYAAGVDGGQTTFIKKFDGTTWSTVHTTGTGGNLRRGVAMVVYDDRLYVLTMDQGANGSIHHTADGTAWTTIALTGLTGLTSLFGILAV